MARVQDRAAATGKWPYPYVTREMIEKRNAELFTPEELLAIQARIDADPEGHRAEMDAFLAEIKSRARSLKRSD